MSRLSEEDISNTDAYKNTRLRLDDVVTRLNHLEAVNSGLQKEIEVLQAERTAYKETIESEANVSMGQINEKLTNNDIQLARIRTERDNANFNRESTRIALEKQISSMKEVKDLAGARQSRIDALEAEVQRLHLALGQEKPPPDEEIASMEREKLIETSLKLKREYDILMGECTAMETAYKRMHELSVSKIMTLDEFNAKFDKVNQEVRNSQRLQKRMFIDFTVTETQNRSQMGSS